MKTVITTLALAALLTACGGGGDSSDSDIAYCEAEATAIAAERQRLYENATALEGMAAGTVPIPEVLHAEVSQENRLAALQDQHRRWQKELDARVQGFEAACTR